MKEIKNIIVDTNLMIDILTVREKPVISDYSKNQLLTFFKKGKNFKLIIAGKKMLNELTGEEYKGKKQNLLELLMLISATSEAIKIEIRNDQAIDELIYKFVLSDKWDGRKDDPNSVATRMPADPHMIYVSYYFDVKYIMTRDKDFAKKVNSKYLQYFPDKFFSPEVICKCYWEDKEFDINLLIK
ncbi:unknown protein [Mesoplasma florum L1]|uniref:PIN domain-containing protein n=1 Tax=Mesoplasma florum (strain ATCC 33453 / NBRC 100688 / NCTC 11704 / L1) TaxID=265311 RepID=Q6F1G9_MESFL|nr:hypothetical protein [Mesoplasma florum]AAT75654.1 unknown protein [Mesoplasma florum L1]